MAHTSLHLRSHNPVRFKSTIKHHRYRREAYLVGLLRPPLHRQAMAAPLTVMDILEGDVLLRVLPYLTIRDLSRTRIASTQTNNNLPPPHESFKVYGHCLFSDYTLRFDTDIDERYFFTGGVVGQYGLGGMGSHQIKFCVPHTTKNLILRAGLKRVQFFVDEIYHGSSSRSDEDMDSGGENCSDQDEEDMEEFAADQDEDVEEIPAAPKTICAILSIWPRGIKVESPHSDSLDGVHSEWYVREEDRDYTFSIRYTASEGGGTTFKLECGEILNSLNTQGQVRSCSTEAHGLVHPSFCDQYTWYVELGDTIPKFASNAVVRIRLIG